jgi:hypothetical protein
MRLNQTQVARKINALANLKSKINKLAVREHELALVIKNAGGGESGIWRADIVHIPAHVRKVRAHEQLRLVEK